MNQIPDRSPQVQRPGWQIKTAELQWLSYSTPSSFPSGHPCGDTGLCVCVCVLHGGKCSHWEHREGLKDGGGRLFVSFCWGRKTACSFTNVIKPLRTKSWQPKAALKSIMDLNWSVFFFSLGQRCELVSEILFNPVCCCLMLFITNTESWALLCFRQKNSQLLRLG